MRLRNLPVPQPFYLASLLLSGLRPGARRSAPTRQNKKIVGALARLALLAAVLAPPAWAWGPGGHMMVAHIAWERLNPHARQEAEKLLAVPLEPDYAWEDAQDFVSASVWADAVKKLPRYAYTASLHFIDQPFSDDHTPLPPGPPPQANIVRALADYVALLKAGREETERALALRLVIHLVGDIHQPLHCASRVSRARPGGDKGGNELEILDPRGHGKKIKLHSYWDMGLQTFPATGPNFAPPPLEDIPPAAEQATADNPDSDPAWKAPGPHDYQAWAKESYELAQSAAYPGIAEGQMPSAAYAGQATRIANRRVAWAGYRLAALLNAAWP